jgi:dTDP-glucose 4,6-dehydratase
MSKQVLLTGVAGFAGAHTLQHFLENTDWHITGIDSLEHAGRIERINQVLAKRDDFNERFTFIKQDLAENSTLLLDTHHDYIINMASESHVDRSITDPLPFVQNNVNLTLNMLELARQQKPRAFIQISTDEVYGPMYNTPFKEWDTLIPSNPYSASKAAQEMLAISYWRTYDVPVVVTNCMNMIGEMQDPEKYLPKVMQQIEQGSMVTIHGEEGNIGTRSYLHARNHADALLFILTMTGAPSMYGETTKPDKYHIAGDEQLDNLDMAQRIAGAMGRSLDYKFVDAHSDRPGHDMHYGLDGSKLLSLGWEPPLNFEESLERTVEWTMQHKEWLQ